MKKPILTQTRAGAACSLPSIVLPNCSRPAAKPACAPPALPSDLGYPAAAARVAPELVRTAPRLGSPLAEHQNAGMWGSVETTVKLAFTGLAGFTLACVVIETAGTAVGKTVAGSSESQNYFVTRTLVELLLALYCVEIKQ